MYEVSTINIFRKTSNNSKITIIGIVVKTLLQLHFKSKL